jgi:hypothetical protein
MTTPVIPGLNRAQRRQMMRAQGWRGSKSKRQFPNRSAHRGQTADDLKAQQEAAVQAHAEHERRQSARHAGLLIPPTTEEIDGLKAQGKITHDPRLILPPGA